MAKLQTSPWEAITDKRPGGNQVTERKESMAAMGRRDGRCLLGREGVGQDPASTFPQAHALRPRGLSTGAVTTDRFSGAHKDLQVIKEAVSRVVP